MRVFRTLWLLHRWLGVAAGLVVLLSATTGFLLLLKKRVAWLQPPVMAAAEGTLADAQPLRAVAAAVLVLGSPHFRSEADIDRIDFRPAQRVHKVTSRHGYQEVQVCAITLRTSGPNPRRSDWIERLHDGSLCGDFVHGTVMPLVALVLCYLACSGYVMWLWPKLRTRQQDLARR